MKRRILVLLTTLNLVTFIPVAGQSDVSGKSEKARQVALKMASDANIADVKLLSGEKRKGRISSVTTDSFTLTDAKTGTSQIVAFAEVDRISKHKALGTGSWIAIGAGAAAAIVLAVLFRQYYCNEGHAC